MALLHIGGCPIPNALLCRAGCPTPNALLRIAGYPTPNSLVCIAGYSSPNALLCISVPYSIQILYGARRYDYKDDANFDNAFSIIMKNFPGTIIDWKLVAHCRRVTNLKALTGRQKRNVLSLKKMRQKP